MVALFLAAVSSTDLRARECPPSPSRCSLPQSSRTSVWTQVGSSRVLPTARQVLKNSGVGDAFNNIGKQLKDGHWVLAFPNVEAANYATLLVDQHAAKLRAYYCEVAPRRLRDTVPSSSIRCVHWYAVLCSRGQLQPAAVQSRWHACGWSPRKIQRQKMLWRYVSPLVRWPIGVLQLMALSHT